MQVSFCCDGIVRNRRFSAIADSLTSRSATVFCKLPGARVQSQISRSQRGRNAIATFLKPGSAQREFGCRVLWRVAVLVLPLIVGLGALVGKNAGGCGDDVSDDTNRIETLTPTQARLLVADFKGIETAFEAGGTGAILLSSGLPLNGLKVLDAETSRILARSAYAGLMLDGVVTLPLDTLQELGEFEGVLSLGGLTQLTPDAARCIAKAKCRKLSLGGVTALGETAASALSEWRGGQLALNGLASLPVGVARALATSQHIKGLSLNGLTNLDPDAAKALTEWPGYYLELDGLITLSAETASGLSGFRGVGPQLSMVGLEALTKDAAESLASFNGRRLCLSGVTAMSREIAIALAKYDGDLVLQEVGALSTEAASAIATHKGALTLGGLSTLSDEAAYALAQYEGDLSIFVVRPLSDKAAAALAEHKGPLRLNGRDIKIR